MVTNQSSDRVQCKMLITSSLLRLLGFCSSWDGVLLCRAGWPSTHGSPPGSGIPAVHQHTHLCDFFPAYFMYVKAHQGSMCRASLDWQDFKLFKNSKVFVCTLFPAWPISCAFWHLLNCSVMPHPSLHVTHVCCSYCWNDLDFMKFLNDIRTRIYIWTYIYLVVLWYVYIFKDKIIILFKK